MIYGWIFVYVINIHGCADNSKLNWWKSGIILIQWHTANMQRHERSHTMRCVRITSAGDSRIHGITFLPRSSHFDLSFSLSLIFLLLTSIKTSFLGKLWSKLIEIRNYSGISVCINMSWNPWIMLFHHVLLNLWTTNLFDDGWLEVP